MSTKTLLVIVIAATIARLFFLGGVLYLNGTEGLMLSDSYGFLLVAENVLDGHGFSKSVEAPFLPEAHFPPLYPLFMAVSLALTGSLVPLVMLQIILSSAMVYLVYLIARRFTEDPRVALVASGLWAFEIMSIVWSVVVLTEVIAIFFLLASILLFLRLLENPSTKTATWTGLFLGLSTLTRPHAQFIFLIGFGFLLFLALKNLWQQNLSNSFKKSVFVLAIFASTFLFTLLPWVTRNYYQFGSLSIATTGLRNVYSSLGASVMTLSTGRPYPEVREEMNEAFAQKHNISVQDIKENPAYGELLAKEGFDILKSHPKETVQVVAISLMTFLTQDLYTDYLQRFRFIPQFNIDFSPSLVLFQEGPVALAKLVWERLGLAALLPVFGRMLWIAINVFWVAGAVVGITRGGKERLIALFLALVILFYASTSTVAGFSDQGRFRYPTTAFMFILASYAAFAFGNYRRNRSKLLNIS